jgi:hypothetical protein
VSFVLPANATFAAVDRTCTTPLVGKTGTIVCEAGLLASGGTCRFVVTVRTATGREKELTGTARVKWGLVDPSTEDNAAALTYVR